MKLSNKDLQKIYFGAYNFAETQDGYLQAFQYTAEQIAYFKEAFEFWYERCTASTSKTIEIDGEYSPAKKGTKVLWRGDNMDGIPTLVKFCDKLKEILAKYTNIKVVDGFKMVPHLPEYFLDNLHPNALGTEVYGRNLVEKIRELKF